MQFVKGLKLEANYYHYIDIPENVKYLIVSHVNTQIRQLKVFTQLGIDLNRQKRDIVRNRLFPIRKPYFVAHRGLMALAPENTLTSFKLAGKNGAWGIETDVYKTSDGHFLLSHDNDISHYTNAPSGTKITENTYDTIRSYTVNVGSYVEKYSDEKIPSLDEYLNICMLYGCVPCIEVKDIGNDYVGFTDYVKQFGYDENLTYTDQSIYSYRKLRPCVGNTMITINMQASPSYSEQVDNLYLNGARNIICAFSPQIGSVTKELIKKCHSYGFLVNIWTLETEDDCEMYIKMGADLITSNGRTKLDLN